MELNGLLSVVRAYDTKTLIYFKIPLGKQDKGPGKDVISLDMTNYYRTAVETHQFVYWELPIHHGAKKEFRK